MAPPRPIHVPQDYQPWPHQVPVLAALERGIKRLILCWHRRAGKDRTALALVIRAMVRTVGSYFYVLGTYNQADRVVWEARGDDGARWLDMFPEPLVAKRNETDLSITLKNGSRFQLLGSDQIDRLLGIGFAGVVFSEFARQRREAWSFLAPVLLANPQAFALFVSTPNGRNHYHRLLEARREDPAWFVDTKTIHETRRPDGTPIISDAAVEDEIRSGLTSREEAQRDYFCSFDTAEQGAVYAEELARLHAEGRVTWVPHDPAQPTYCAWDLGIANTAIWCFQRDGRLWRWIDFFPQDAYSGRGSVEAWLTTLHRTEYDIAGHNGPHDFTRANDVTGESALSLVKLRGAPVEIVPRISVEHPLRDAHDAVRRALSLSRFDAQRCAKGLECLAGYVQEVGGTNPDPQPVKNRYRHGADAFRHAVQGFRAHELAVNFRAPAVVTVFDPFIRPD